MNSEEVDKIVKTLLSIGCDTKRDHDQRIRALEYAKGLTSAKFAGETLNSR